MRGRRALEAVAWLCWFAVCTIALLSVTERVVVLVLLACVAVSGVGMAAAFQTWHEQPPTIRVLDPHDLCRCGHTRRAHIYDEGACRPGFVCTEACTAFINESGGR